MIVSVDNVAAAVLAPVAEGREVVVAVDASKTNTALAVGDMSGEVLHWIELNGTDEGTTEYDTLCMPDVLSGSDKRESFHKVDLCQYFGQKKLKDYADFLSSSSSFCWGVI